MTVHPRDKSRDILGAGGNPDPVEAARDPARLVIDPVRAILEDANDAGRALLALSSTEKLPAALDGLMPAIQRLRAYADMPEPYPPETLVFWWGGRNLALDAVVKKLPQQKGRTLLALEVLPSLHPAPGPAGPDAASPPSPARSVNSDPRTGVDPPPAKRDDKETLKEIARRIREGSTPVRTAIGEGFASSPALVSSSPTPSGTRQSGVAVPDQRSLARLAHELKTPLSAIVAASEIMRDEQLGPMENARYLGYAGDINESAKHALAVINAMLTGTTHELRKNEPVDLNEISRATVSSMQALAAAAEITLDADCPDGALEVTGDPTAIRQIILNLVSNALKFTPAGGDVRVVTGYLPDGSIFLVVRDTGEGMSEDLIARAFYGGEAREGPRPGGGYGIGLPLVRQLTEAMGASIDVDSAPGKGTVVLLSFPHGRSGPA